MKHPLPDGFKVFVTHYRQFEGEPMFMTTYDAKSEGLKGPLHCGGATEARIVDEEGQQVASAFSWCSRKDNFSKYIGRNIAVGRALKSFKGATS